MTLGALLRGAADRAPFPGAIGMDLPGTVAGGNVSAIAYDSRAVEPGAVFVALRGVHADGAQFARDAIARGASIVVADTPAPPGIGAPWVQVSDARLAIAALAAVFYGDPSGELALVGVTGTNGKTTTTYLLAAIFEAAGVMCGRIGSYRLSHRKP